MPYCRLKNRNNSRGEKIFYVDYKYQDRRSKFTIGAVEYRAAKKIADKIQGQLIEGINPHLELLKSQSQNEPLRFDDLGKKYLEHCELKLQSSTVELKREAIKNLSEFLSNPPVSDITPELIEQ